MKYITDCIKYKGETIYSTYEYSKDSRHGCILWKDKKMKTSGTFSMLIRGSRLITGNYNEICVIDLDTSSSPQSTTYKNNAVNYYFAEYDGIIYSTGLGCYSEVDTNTGHTTEHPCICDGKKCIHDILSIAVDKNHIYIGCDGGYLSCINRSTHEVQYTRAFSAGITWLSTFFEVPEGRQHVLEIGTYTGEYAMIMDGETVLQKNTKSIIWRIHKVNINGDSYNVVAQSYDGIGIYTSQMELVQNIPTSDLVYTIDIDEAKGQAYGYNYYTGEVMSVDLHAIAQNRKTK
ncbi:hypothetical protein NERG_00057 [Nematocida ausubeli]|uniref:Uncharacterized protein n=1 Tax=Nematocida ausubeli (strain ATCC PRA-371 / ERTm2) TaxID=1913371 RepID=H8Z8Y6_NEMA1|nr:hypothetical protein NERG_00057 [Nematocida ausubeli]